MDFDELVAGLRVGGGDTASVEVKSAAGGLPDSITASLSALANLPGGGLVILGLDEGDGFAAVELADPHLLRQGLASMARKFEPPVRLVIHDDARVAGRLIVAATVVECDPSAKPCRVRSTGKAYARGHDGDYELSDLEMQAFMAQRTQPRFDRRIVPDASADDLDVELVRSWISTARALDPDGLGRFSDDDELLTRGGVVAQGRPTTAGLLVLGRHPQQWFPRFVIQAAVEPPPAAERERASNVTTIAGPIPRMLNGALEWARRSFDRTTMEAADGSVGEHYAFPIEAFRELISNALVHRDLDAWSEGRAIEVRYSPRRLVVSSPGGLWGITRDRLGLENISSARNPLLLSICQYARTAEGADRVVEALAQGLPRVHAAMQEFGLPLPTYVDRAINFAVLLTDPSAGQRDLPSTQAAVFEALAGDWRSVADLASVTGLEPPNIRRALRALRERDLVEVRGGRGRQTSYRRPESGAG